MKKNIKSALGRVLANSKDILSMDSRSMTILNAAGDIDPATTGYQYTLQTTTLIRAKVIKQKFYTVPVADFLPVIHGEGAWMDENKTNLVYDVAGAFETGIISVANAPAQLSTVDIATAPVTQKVITVAKGYQYSNPEVQKALASANWDVIQSKLETLKKHFDLGLQKIGFLGLSADETDVPGLLTQTSVNINTTDLTQNISSMNYTQFGTLVSVLLKDYAVNCAYTEVPDTFIIPMDDFLGLGTPINPQFPNISMLEYLENMFKRMTGNANFRVLGLAYSNLAQNAGYVSTNGKNRYVLYKNDPDCLWMDVTVPFLLTPAGTSNNFNWQGVGVVQFSGVMVARPATVTYFDHS